MAKETTRSGRDNVHIAHVVQNLGIGGLERIVVALMEHVDAAEFTSSVYCLASGGELLDEVKRKGFATTVIGKRSGIKIGLPFRLAGLFRHARVDIVHCHNFGPMFYGGLAGRLSRRPAVVYTAHGPDFPHNKRRAFFQRLPVADKVVTVSDFVRRSALEDAGLRTNRVTTIRNGIELDRFQASDGVSASRGKSELGLGEHIIVIGVVARLSREKDHRTLIEAFASIASHREDVHLVVVGDGDMMSSLQGLTRDLGISEVVSFLGNRTDIPELLSAFDVYALSSRDEGLGITLLEAMAMGVPVVSTSVGGIPEIVDDGRNGLLVPPGDPSVFADAIEWVLRNPDAANAMAEKALAKIQTDYSMSNMIGKYENLYRDLLGEKVVA